MKKNENSVVVIGYSGHSYVAIDVLSKMGMTIVGYLEKKEKAENPFQLKFLGDDNDAKILKKNAAHSFFIGVGENKIREKIFQTVTKNHTLISAIHPSAIIGAMCTIGYGSMIAAGSIINPLCKIGNGVICNTGVQIDHECMIDDFVHLAPGAVLCGNVSVGKRTFIGANSVVKQGITIGKNCIIGAGSVVVKNVPDNSTWVGNPAKSIKK